MRLGIMNLYDKEGIIDDCRNYLIEHLMCITDRLIIVCNQEMDMTAWEDSKKMPIVVRNTRSWHQVHSVKHILWDLGLIKSLPEYDELLIVNDSFFGPVFPFSEMLIIMGRKPCDFWSMIKVGERIDEHELVAEEHLDLSFAVIKKRMLQSIEFRNYWKQMEDCGESTDETAEIDFTQYFTNAGFISETYIDPSDYIRKRVIDNFDPSLTMEYELIRYGRYPIIKKKCFIWNEAITKVGFGDGLSKAMSYIKEDTEYPVDMIWKHVLRCYHITDIYESMHLNYILPICERKMAKQSDRKTAAVILHLHYRDLLEKSFEYISVIPKEIDVIVTSSELEIRKCCENYFLGSDRKNYRIIAVENRGRDAAALFIGCRKISSEYRYICFLHDKKTSGSVGACTIGQSFMDNVFENLLKSEDYIQNILELFEDNPRLGLLSPPIPYYAMYLKAFADPWTICFKETQKLAERLGLHNSIRSDKPPFALSTCFWCRTAALEKILAYDFTYEDFPEEPMKVDGEINHAIERILIYVAQEAGYFSGTVENIDFASVDLSNLNYTLRMLIKANCNDIFFFDRDSLMSILGGNTVQRFCLCHSKVYIYGAGEMADYVVDTLEKEGIPYAGFIVSDGQMQLGRKREHEVWHWSDIILEEEDGIVLALNAVNKAQVMPMLTDAGVGREKIYTL